MTRSTFFIGIIGLLSVNFVSTVPITEFYPYGTQNGDIQLAHIDDGSSPIVQMSSEFPFFSTAHSSLYVNTNGVISFERAFTNYDPVDLTNGPPIIAAFWSDVDTRNGGSILYRQSTDKGLLSTATQEIRPYITGLISFEATWIFIATWVDVAFYGASGDNLQKRNTFQAVLITNGRQSFTIFKYNKITWTQDIRAQVGYNKGDGVNYFMVNQSRTVDIIQLPQLSNVQVPGKFIFRVDTASIDMIECNAIEVDCGSPVNKQHSTWHFSQTIFNSKATLSCNEGFVSNETISIDCKCNRQWDSTNTSCKAVSCGQPSAVKHGTWMTTGLVYNSTGTLKCDEGYITNTSGTIHCLSNGSWSVLEANCSLKSCGHPVIIENGSWNVKGVTVNSTAILTCDEGFTNSTVDSITCMADGNWKNANITCEVVSCGLPTTVIHGTWMTTGLTYSSTGTLKCDAGYTTNTSRAIKCLSNGSWSISDAKCSLKSCGHPVIIENGRWNVKGVTVNSTAILTCDEGFTNSTVDSITCMADGNWKTANITCEVVSCGLPTTVIHGTWMTTGLVYNSTGTLKCDAGYTTNTSSAINCLSNGSWSISDAKCSLKSCGFPVSIENGSWNVTGETVNSTAVLVCDEGFTASTVDQISCTVEGNWTDSNVTCEVKSCDYPAGIENGNWNVTGIKVNSTAVLVCHEGFTNSTIGQITCMSGGTWTKSNVTCKDIQAPNCTIIKAPALKSNENIVEFTFTCNEPSTTKCSLKSQGKSPKFVDCGGPQSVAVKSFTTPTLITATMYTFDFYGTDASGKRSATQSYTWETDFVKPFCKFIKTPPIYNSERNVEFAVFCNEATRLRCTITKGNNNPVARACGGDLSTAVRQYTTQRLDSGYTYIFTVYSSDDAGNEGDAISHQWHTEYQASLAGNVAIDPARFLNGQRLIHSTIKKAKDPA